MKVVLVEPQGFCGGVFRAINIAIEAKETHPNNRVFVLGALVHNQTVLDDLNKKGIFTLEGDDETALIRSLKEDDVLVFSAHGHNERLDLIAKELHLIVYDTTCPRVKMNMNIIKNNIEKGHQVIYVGQKGHRETNAALSISNNISLYDINIPFNYYFITDKSPIVINQTTLNYLDLSAIHEDIMAHIPEARITNEICSATRLRQEAVLKIKDDTDLVVVVGDKRSSNTQKLYDIAVKHLPNALTIMVLNLDELKTFHLEGKKKAAILSGASTPQYVVNEINSYLSKL